MKKISVFVAAAMVAVAVWLSAPNGALAQDLPDFGQTRAAVAACANLPGPAAGATATCAQWSALANCIVQALASSPTCSVDAVQAEKALHAMQTTCDANHAAEVQALRAQLTECGGHGNGQSTQPRRISVPRCIGSAQTVCHVRGAARDTWISGREACVRAAARIDRASCACREGVPVIRVAFVDGRSAHNTFVCMGDFVSQQTRVEVQHTEAVDESGLAALRARVDQICRMPAFVTNANGVMTVHPDAPPAPDGGAVPRAEARNAHVAHNCAALNARVIQLLLHASNGINPVNLGPANVRMDQIQEEQRQQRIVLQTHTGQIGTLTGQVGTLQRDVNDLRRQRSRSNGWQLSLGTGISGGWTSVSDLGGPSAFSETGFTARYWFNHVVGLHAGASVIFGSLGAPGINNVGGYVGQAGVSIHLAPPSESISLVFDLGAYVRTYALTGFESVGNLADARMVGDYAGRTAGARAAATIAFAHGLVALTLSLDGGYGENVYFVPFRGTVNVMTGDGGEVLPGLAITFGLGEPPAVSVSSAPEPAPVAAPMVPSTPTLPAAPAAANDNATAAPAAVTRPPVVTPPPVAANDNLNDDSDLAEAAGF